MGEKWGGGEMGEKWGGGGEMGEKWGGDEKWVRREGRVRNG